MHITTPTHDAFHHVKRDPVARSVEGALRKLARNEGTRFIVNEVGNGQVNASFDAACVRGETRDIAILRLVNTLFEAHRFAPQLTRALGKLEFGPSVGS